MLTRRSFLAASGAATATLGTPNRLWAQDRLSLGTAQLITLSDGNLVLPGDFILADLPKEETALILKHYGLSSDPFTPPCNVTLLQDGTNTILFDVGAGPDFQPSAGKLAEALATLGISAEEVTHVCLTHAHPDHLWGLLDEFDEPVFANAQHMIGRAEFDYWMDPNTVSTIGDARTTFAVGAARRLETVAEQLTLIEDGQEVLTGVAAWLTPGHTPGHMAFEVRIGGDAVMILGDSIGNHHIGFERPQWPTASDQDPAQGATTRAALLDRLSHEQMRFIGFHLPGGGLGRAEKGIDGFRFMEA